VYLETEMGPPNEHKWLIYTATTLLAGQA